MQYEDFNENERNVIDKFKIWIDANVRKDLQNLSFITSDPNCNGILKINGICNKDFCKENLQCKFHMFLDNIFVNNFITTDLLNKERADSVKKISEFIILHNFFIKKPQKYNIYHKKYSTHYEIGDYFYFFIEILNEC